MKQLTCLQGELLECAGRSSFKRLILATLLNLILLRNMSVVGLDDVKDQYCEHGKVNQRPPISYTQFRYKLWVTEPNTIKIKLPGGNQFTCELMNNVDNTETCLKWIQIYNRVLGEMKLRVNLNVATKERKKVLNEMKKFLKVPKRETPRPPSWDCRQHTNLRYPSLNGRTTVDGADNNEAAAE